MGVKNRGLGHIKATAALETLLHHQDEPASLEAKAKCLRTLEVIYQSRFMDDKMSILVKQNKGGTFHMNGLGHELIGAVSALSLTPGKDWGFPYYRDKSFAIGLGACLVELFGTFMGRATQHHSSGRMMPEHFSHQGLRIPVQSSVVGSQFLQAVGLAKGLKASGKDEVVYVSAGDGATSQGDFHEALNYACIHQLGVIFVIQDNGWAISVPVRDQTAGGSIAKITQGYEGLTTHDVNGCDYEEVSRALALAVKKGRSMQGPSVIVAKVPRLGPHSSSDDPKKYKEEHVTRSEQERDPIVAYENWLVEMGLFTTEEMDALKINVKQQIDEAAKRAENIPFPDPKTCRLHVIKPHLQEEIRVEGARGKQEAIVMVDALNHALAEEMEENPGIVVFGQDVAGGKGGVFGVTRGLTEKFGQERCFNTPLAESTIIGTAIGMSFDGVHIPVAEIQFADYLWTGINQLFNELASIHYRSNGEWNCPVVIRMPAGGYIQGGPYHSQSIEGFLAHCPGLKIVLPSNAEDAKLLLKAAIRDPNPVIFLEHKGLYRQRAFSARAEPYPEEVGVLGKAKVLREGNDVTVVTWGMTAVMAFEITEKLAKEEGIEAELIDLRTMSPLDIETILRSVQKTGKVLIAHEAPKHCGLGAEIAARISEEVFTYLDAPIKRIGSVECAIPYSKVLEDAVLPQKKEIEQAIVELAQF
jgi:2-oxoisovalerate dehydrogenase E1 component